MLLTYEAIDAKGKSKKASVEAGSPSAALEQLRRQGLYVTTIQEQQEAQPEAGPAVAPGSGTLSVKALALMTRQMAMLLRAGSAVVPSLVAVRRQLKNAAHRALMTDVINDLEEGAAFSESLARHPRVFDPTFCAIVQAGEASATLPEMFERLASMVGKRKAMRNKVLGALAYPCLLVFMSIHIIAVLFLFVLPRFAGMFDTLGADIPASTQFMLDASDIVLTYWWLGATLLLAFAAGLFWLLRTAGGRQFLADCQTRIPVLGRVFSRLIQGQVLRTIGLMLESGVGVLESLALARATTANRDFQRLFDDIEQVVTSGGAISSAFEESKLVEPFVAQAVATGEESGNLGGAMAYCADMLDESNTELVNATTKLIEPVILIGMGIVVGTVAVSLFMPLFDLTSAVNG